MPMGASERFDRCLYCFAEKHGDGICPACGCAQDACLQSGEWLPPGTILKGRYLVGQHMVSTKQQLTYLGWDLAGERKVEITEYFPRDLVTRDATYSSSISCIPGNEERVERGKQEFFEKAKLFYNCVSRVEILHMDFFVRNETCYHVRLLKEKSEEQNP